MDFNKGDKFSSWMELLERKSQYELAYHVELWVRDSRTIEAAKTKAPKRAASANPELKYFSATLCCRSGGRCFKSNSQGKRQTR